ncbi:MAG: DUF3617 family protein [Burkholderiales bacterium]
MAKSGLFGARGKAVREFVGSFDWVNVPCRFYTVVFAGWALAADAADLLPTPGHYEVEVRISLPNVQDIVAPLTLNRCMTFEDFESGRMFAVLSDNPLKLCERLDYEASDGTITFRIECPGPNRGSAVAVFKTHRSGYRGSIKMNLGGKNMTMTEIHIGRRIGNCE